MAFLKRINGELWQINPLSVNLWRTRWWSFDTVHFNKEALSLEDNEIIIFHSDALYMPVLVSHMWREIIWWFPGSKFCDECEWLNVLIVLCVITASLCVLERQFLRQCIIFWYHKEGLWSVRLMNMDSHCGE